MISEVILKNGVFSGVAPRYIQLYSEYFGFTTSYLPFDDKGVFANGTWTHHYGNVHYELRFDYSPLTYFLSLL